MPSSPRDLKFPHRHLLGIEGLSPPDIATLLDLAEAAVEVSRQVEKKRSTLARAHPDQPVLRGLDPHPILVRARRQAARRRRHEHVGRRPRACKKGETLIDTAMTLNAMRPDIIVVRHAQAGAVDLLARKVDCSVINAGDGAHEHPTQALLDALTIRRNKGGIDGADGRDLRRHPAFPRRALEHPAAFRAGRAGARRSDLRPCCRPASSAWASRCSATCATGLAGADIVMMLRLQRERMQRRLRALGAGIFPLLRPRRGQACASPSRTRWSCIRGR